MLKYALWDKEHKQWADPSDSLLLAMDGRIVSIDHDGAVYNLSHYFEVIRYTGVKDKKGVEIKEKDIVSWKVGTLRVTGVVEYSPDYGLWIKGNNQNLGSYQKSTEIIGHALESPEMAK